ncbi:hypothetical protein C5706_33385, partial [Klebsiella pneumoniae]
AVLVQNGSVSHAFGLNAKKGQDRVVDDPKESLNIAVLVQNGSVSHAFGLNAKKGQDRVVDDPKESL